MSKNVVKRCDYKSALQNTLHSLKDKYKYDTARDFISYIYDYFRNQNYDVGLSTIEGWYYGKTFPEIDNLLVLCDCLDCDLDYLLGRITESKHDIKYIRSVTGLSEESIRTLTAKDYSVRNLLGQKKAFSIHPLQIAVDTLLKNSENSQVLQDIGLYLYSNDYEFIHKDNKLENTIMLHDRLNGKNFPFSSNDIASILMMNIQSKLSVIRSNIIKK